MLAILTMAALLGAGSAPNPVQAENSLAGTEPNVWLEPAVPPTSIEGYASELSVLPGEQVHLHVSTREGDRYRVELYRLGWYGGLGAHLISCVPSCSGDEGGRTFPGPQASTATVTRADWPVTDTVTVPAGATSGYYYALLRVTAGGDDVGARGYVVFIVREAPGRHSEILVQVPVNTWQAYNPWGGKSLYKFNSTNGVAATRVSFDRPLVFTSQGPFDAEYNLVRFLEHEGYDVSYQTDADTDLHPESLVEHRLVVVAGHDEYWSKRMRDAFDAARDAGTNLAFTGSNAAYWQVRYEDGERTIVGYKSIAADPEPNPALKTALFRELGRPECELMGVMHLRLRPHQSGPVDYRVMDGAVSDPWFAGTGLHPGDTVQDIVGNEWDSLPDPPPPPDCVKPGLKVLFRYQGEPADADAVRYTAPSGARVFAGGAQQLSWSLDGFNLRRFGHTAPADPRFQTFMRNALDDLTRPAAPLGLRVKVRPLTGTVDLRVRAVTDARVTSFEIFRHGGAGAFQPTDPGVFRVCRTASTCKQRRLRRGIYRFAAVAVDQWGASAPTLTPPIRIRGRHCFGLPYC